MNAVTIFASDSKFMATLNWCCVSCWIGTTNAGNTHPSHDWCQDAATNCRDPTIVAWRFRWLINLAHPQRAIAAKRRSVCYVWMLYRWKGDIGFLCLCRLTAKEKLKKKVTLAWNIKTWCAWDWRPCFASICIQLFLLKCMDLAKTLFVSDCLRSQHLCQHSQQDW